MTQPTREDALAHFGVKGMKWGVRKARVTEADVVGAQRRQESRLNAFLDADAKANDPNISAKARARFQKQADKLEKAHDANEDRVTSQRISRGRKTALILLTGPIGAAVIAGNAIGVRRTIKDVERVRAGGKAQL